MIDLHGNKTQYFYDQKTLRLSKIEWYQGKETLLKRETLTWDPFGNLLSKEISKDQPICTFAYTYNEFGFLTSKTQIGTITSKRAKERYTTTYTYNEQNLLSEETEDNGQKTTYTYLPSTNLPTTKILQKNGQVIQRIFYEYNEDHILINEIVDDGPNYTERQIKRIIPRKENPFFGLPEFIEEYYLEGYSEKLLRKTHFTYDERGNITKKTHYDSANTPRFQEETEYNNKDQIIQQIDPEGYATSYAHDDNGNILEETSPLHLTTQCTYDTLNHCTKKVQANEKTQYSEFTFDGKPTLIIGPLQEKTIVQYDALGSPISETNPKGHTTHTSYNALGQQEKDTDPQGHITHTSYNIFGSPLTITHPDGTKEHYIYSLDGKLLSHTDQKNIKTLYTYDNFDHIIQEETLHENKSLSKLKRKYNAFHLLEEIDSEGVQTKYTYKPSGHLAQKIEGECITTYAYDTLGRCIKENTLEYTIEKAYDNLDRIILKQEYANDKLLTKETFTYDAASNILTHTTYPNNQKATTTLTYDPFGREIEKIDPEGHKTTTTHLLGKEYRQTKTQEPGEITTLVTYNTLNQPITFEKIHQSKQISKTTSSYDPCGNLTQFITTIYRDHAPFSTHTLETAYNSMHHKIRETEQSQKTTQYTYTPKGELATLTKPNGTILTYTYTPLGPLKTLHSNDNTIHYSYTYNTKGQLLTSHDHIHNTSTTRILDPYGNILEETLANGLTLKNTYAPLHRRISLELPNEKTIFYTYEGPYLKSVYIDPHTHTYTRDLNGNILFEDRSHQDEIQKKYDLLNRPTQLLAPNFSQQCSYDIRGNLTEMHYRKREQHYTYDPHDQLISEPYHTYTYDSLHNRIKKDKEPYTLNPLNQIEKTPQKNCIYDANGNLTSYDATTFAYDALDRLIQVTTPEKTTTYSYDSEHRRIAKNTEQYLWDGQHELGTLNCYRILGPTENAEIGSAVILFKEDTPHFLIHDLQGNLITITDLSNNSEKRTFTAFGEPLGPLNTPWGFCSKRHDPETEFVYFGRRYYSPELGRFITADPEGYTDSQNLYAYCTNNPLTHFDPYGLFMDDYLDQKKQEHTWKELASSFHEMHNSFFSGVTNSLLSNAEFFGGAGTLGCDILGLPFKSSFSNTQNLLSTTQSMQSWADQTFTYNQNSIRNTIAYGMGLFGTEAALVYMTRGRSLAKPIAQVSKKFASLGGANKVANIQRQFFQGLKTKSACNVVRAPSNCAVFEQYKVLLRTQMEKPHVVDSRLKKLVDRNYKSHASIGSGSTAAAIRHELATGEKVFNRLHSQKGRDTINTLEKWLRNNSTARPGDRAAAENMIKDLCNALGE